MMITRRDSLEMQARRLERDDPYFVHLGHLWSDALAAAHRALPSPPWMDGL